MGQARDHTGFAQQNRSIQTQGNGPERFANRSVLPPARGGRHSRRQEEHPMTRQLLRRALPFAAAAILAVGLAPNVPSTVAAQDAADGRVCSTHTLRGAYGLVGTGTRGLNPVGTEQFVTISMVTYDGEGNFTADGVSHGQTTGVRGGPVDGTYYVNADCTGGQTTFIPIPGVPPLEDKFVIVDNGREVRTVVVSPLTTVATANLRKK
jgi:hypothetical protein